MNIHQKQELSLFAEELYRYMSPATLNQLAIEVSGMKRKRKCHGHHFLFLSSGAKFLNYLKTLFPTWSYWYYDFKKLRD